jgi:hypothetical protein
MSSKISKIFKTKSNNMVNNNSYKNYLNNSKTKSEIEKWKIFKIAEDNQYLLKRLNDAQTSYNHRKYEDDYKKSLYYKQNICEFPQLIPKFHIQDFEIPQLSKTNYKFFNNNQSSGLSTEKKFNKTNQTIKNKTEYSSFYKNNSQLNIKQEEEEGSKVLFHKKVFFKSLFYCVFKIYIEDKKFVIHISPKDMRQTVYLIIIENISEVLKMKELFNVYEDLIEYLDHSHTLDLVMFIDLKIKIQYVSLKVNIDIYDISNLSFIISSFKKGEISGKIFNEERRSIKKDDNLENWTEMKS